MTAAKWWEGHLLGFDLETTGIDVFSDRIVTAALVDIEPGQRPKTTAWLVNPGVDIPAEATAIHGITTEHARASGTDAAQAVFEIGGRIALHLSRGLPLVAFNAAFDLSMLEAENQRHDMPTLVHRLAPKPVMPVVDPFVIDRGIDQYRKGKRTLDASCQHYGVTLAGAHTSDADAIAACRLAVVMARGHSGIRSWSLPNLHAAQVQWRQQWAKSFGEYLRKQGKDASDVVPDWPIRVRTPVQEGLVS